MEKDCLVFVSSTMLSPLVSWILSSSSSSSSSASSDYEEEESLEVNTDELEHENDIVVDEDNDQNDHSLTSCDVDNDDDTIPVALAIPDASPSVTVAFPTADQRNTIPAAATTIATRPKRQRSERTTNYYYGAGRQYQRLWTKQDEMELLKGYLDYMKQHRKENTTSLQNDVALLYDHVRPKLNVGFNKNQLVEKLRRLKRKHKVNSAKEVSFKSLHDKSIFEISHKIWGNELRDQYGFDGYGSSPVKESHDLGNVNIINCDDHEIDNNKVPKRLRLSNDQNNDDSAIGIEGLIEETMRSCFSPLVKELVLDDAHDEGSLGGLELNPMPLCSGELRKRRILELEVYLNRLELLQSQIKARLEELRSG